jgi:hypothetical protein
MKTKTSTLTGLDLNRAVAMALGQELVYRDSGLGIVECVKTWLVKKDGLHFYIPNYATDITAAWPIIVKQKISLGYTSDGEAYADSDENAAVSRVEYGPDPITAAMRCFVASVLGDEVNLEAP